MLIPNQGQAIEQITVDTHTIKHRVAFPSEQTTRRTRQKQTVKM